VNAQIQDFNQSGCIVDGVPTLDCVQVLFSNLLFMSGALVLFILLIMFIMGGFNYLTSFGSEEKIKKAQGTIKYAIFGLVIYVSAYLILNIIDIVFLGGCGKIFHFDISGNVADPCLHH
jgi:hypothetical protein